MFDGRDPVLGCRDLREVYDLLSPGGRYTGRCTAPLLIDRQARKAVCNESSLIARNLAALARPPGGSAGSGGGMAVDLVPAGLEQSIDAWNDRIYETGG